MLPAPVLDHFHVGVGIAAPPHGNVTATPEFNVQFIVNGENWDPASCEQQTAGRQPPLSTSST